MKKYLLLFCLTGITALFAYSQSFQLSDSTGLLANNATILKYGMPSADEIISYVSIKNTTGSPIPVKVKKVELNLVHGAAVAFCWGLCYIPEVFVSPDSIIIDAGATNSTDFSGHYYPQGIVGISTIRYVFFNANNPNDSVCVNIEFSTYPQGINDLSGVTLSNACPNPANNSVSLSYSVPQNSNAKLIIRNVLGSVVKDLNIAGNSGQINLNTTELADGVYFYSFLVDGKSQVTKKLVIRH